MQRLKTPREKSGSNQPDHSQIQRLKTPREKSGYNTAPVLIQNFVETPRHTGAVYNASGWIRVGTTQGRGRYDRHTKRAQPKKDIWLRTLRKDWKRTLNR